MQNKMAGEQCALCSAGAAVRVSGTSFCASCGLQYSAEVPSGGVPTPVPGAKPRSSRTAVLGLLSSAFLLRMLFGAVAVAAVGGVAAAAVLQDGAPNIVTQAVPATSARAVSDPTGAIPGLTTTTTTTTDVATTTAETVPVGSADPDGAAQQVEAVHEYAAAIQVWADCVSDAAAAHSAGKFDRVAACGEKPRAGVFGLGVDDDAPGKSDDAPGLGEDGPGNSESAPGLDQDGPGNSENAPGQSRDAPAMGGDYHSDEDYDKKQKRDK